MNRNKLLRITQMNAIYLDKEIYKSLYQIIQDATKNLPPGIIAPIEPEIKLVLRLIILSNSILNSGSTFGQQLLAIKYEHMSNIQKLLYFVPHCYCYIKTKLEIWTPSHNINNIIFNIYTVTKFIEFINLSVFLRKGEKPLLIERILGLNQTYATKNGQRHFESKYLARELLWNGFIELLVCVLPMINYHKIKRTLKHVNPMQRNPVKPSLLYATNMTMHSKCAFCKENPIIPHHMGCSHVFCYICLKGNQTADSKFECPICEHRNENILCDRVTTT